MDAIEQLLPREKHKFVPDQFVRFKRNPLFDNSVRICDHYRSATAIQQSWLRSRIDRLLAGNLRVFGLRAAILAARERSPSLSRTSLTAFAIVDLAAGDVREVLIGLSLICYCGTLSGAKMPTLFREIASVGGLAVAAIYEDWASRYPDVQGISSMGWREVDTDEGVGFRHG